METRDEEVEVIVEFIAETKLSRLETAMKVRELLTRAIQTAKRQERVRIKKEITGCELLNLNSEIYIGLGDALWVCDSQEERDAFTKALTPITQQ